MSSTDLTELASDLASDGFVGHDELPCASVVRSARAARHPVRARRRPRRPPPTRGRPPARLRHGRLGAGRRPRRRAAVRPLGRLIAGPRTWRPSTHHGWIGASIGQDRRMANLLANPLDELKGPKGQAPAWIWKVAGARAPASSAASSPASSSTASAQQGQHQGRRPAEPRRRADDVAVRAGLGGRRRRGRRARSADRPTRRRRGLHDHRGPSGLLDARPRFLTPRPVGAGPAADRPVRAWQPDGHAPVSAPGHGRRRHGRSARRHRARGRADVRRAP